MSLVGRMASLAALPVTTGARLAGAAAASVLGADRDAVYTQATSASVEALAAALAKARGPALKFGQVLALLATGLPPEQRAALGALDRLYENAQPVPLAKLGSQLVDLPEGVVLEPEAVAAASLGQVHRGVWVDGSDVAVKVQYRDAARIVRSDMLQLRALAPLVGRLLPSLDVSALLSEHAERLAEELDYRREAQWQEEFRRAWDGTEVVVPEVLAVTPSLLVSRWVDGVPLTQLASRPQSGRDSAGRALARFCLWSPARVGACHADPHPGNFRLLADGRLAVLDFGSVAAGAGVFTRLFADTMRAVADGDQELARQLWLNAGMLDPATTAEQLADLLGDGVEPYESPEFRFSAEWMQRRASGWLDPAAAVQGVSRLQFPPEYLLEHRAVMGTLALLCSIGATVDFRTVVDGVSSPR